MNFDKLPGELVDGVARGLTGGVKSAVSGIASTARGAGASIQNGVDVPFQALGLNGSPLRIIGHPLDGAVNAGENFVNNGVLGSVEILGDSITEDLDTIPKTIASVGGAGNGPF